MHEHNRKACDEWAQYVPNTPFKYIVGGYNRGISQSRQREIIESFGYMDLLGKIDMKNPDVTFGCFEECEKLSILSPKTYINSQYRRRQPPFRHETAYYPRTFAPNILWQIGQ